MIEVVIISSECDRLHRRIDDLPGEVLIRISATLVGTTVPERRAIGNVYVLKTTIIEPGIGQISPVEVSTRKRSMFEIYPRQVCIGHICVSEGGAPEVRIGEVRVIEDCVGEIRVKEVRIGESGVTIDPLGYAIISDELPLLPDLRNFNLSIPFSC